MASRGLLIIVFVAGLTSVSGGAVVDLEGLTLEAESYWNGSDGSGGFVSVPAHFGNNYDSGFGSWDGFAYSNITDTEAEGWAAQYNAITGGGEGGSSNYAVCYMGYAQAPVVTLEEAAVVEGFYVTNTNYAYYSMLKGDAYAKKFGGESGSDEDWFLLTVTGKDSGGEMTGTADFYLADFRYAESERDYIVDRWEWVNLASLGVVKRLEFSMDSSDVGAWGMNTPGYFAMDSMVVVPEPATMFLLGLGGIAMLRRKGA
jgi:hypothetical protein